MKGFKVPKSDQKEFKALVQRAERRVKSALNYIDKHDIHTWQGMRSVVFNYYDKENWHTDKTIFSRSTQFASKQEYQQYKRHLMQWGEELPRGQRHARHPASVRQAYIERIKKTFTDIAVAYDIPLENGKLPKEFDEKLNKLTFDQLTNFYGSSDPSEDLRVSEFETDTDIEVGNRESMVHLFNKRIAEVESFIH